MDRRTVSVAAAGFCTFVNLYTPQSLLPTLEAAFDAGVVRAGLTITAPLVAVALIAPVVGGISDAVGRRRLILAACFALVVPTALASLAPNLDLLILCRFAQGLLLPFIFTVTVAYIADECPGPAGVRATGWYATGTIMGGFLGRFIAGWTAQYLGWRAAFAAVAALTLLVACVVALLMPAEQRFRPVRGWLSTARGFAGQFRNRQVVATCVVGFAVLFSITAAFTYANVMLAAPPFHLGPAELGSVFLTYLLGAVSPPFASRLILRFGRRATLLLSAASAVIGLLLTLMSSLPVILAGLSLIALGVLTEQTVSIGYVAVVADRSRSTAVGLYVTAYYAGGSLGGIAPAWIWSHLGWPGCVGLVLLVQLFAATVAVLVWPGSTGQAKSLR